jgi:hypothetical protein
VYHGVYHKPHPDNVIMLPGAICVSLLGLAEKRAVQEAAGSHDADPLTLRYVGTQAVWQVGVVGSVFFPHFGHFI